MRGDEACLTTIQTKVGALVDLPLQVAAKTENDFVFLSDDFGEIDADIRGVDSPASCVSGVVSDLRAMDHRFSRRTTDIDASAAEILFFDERHGPAEIRQTIPERIAGLTRADNDSVIFHEGLRKRNPSRLYIRCASVE